MANNSGKKNKHSFRMFQLKNKQKKDSIVKKLNVKSIVLPEVYTQDDATINYIKRTGGQVFQHYSLRDLTINAQDNSTYYYLVSDSYAITPDAEVSRINIENFTIDVMQTKITVDLNKVPEPYHGTGSALKMFDNKTVIAYTYISIPTENFSSSIKSFSMTNNIAIKYSPYGSKDEIHATGTRGFKFSTERFPIINKNYKEATSLVMENFTIEVWNAN